MGATNHGVRDTSLDPILVGLAFAAGGGSTSGTAVIRGLPGAATARWLLRSNTVEVNAIPRMLLSAHREYRCHMDTVAVLSRSAKRLGDRAVREDKSD